MILGDSTTLNAQLLARVLGEDLSPGDEVIVTNLDHEANVGPWRELERRGAALREWRFHPETLQLELDDLERLLTERTRLVCFTHCSNLTGALQDAAAICARVREAGATSCVDGVAYAPHRRVDVKAIGADYYFTSLYKTFGPHLGLLYGRRELLLAARSPNHFFVPADRLPVKFEPGNVNYELTASLAAIPAYFDELARHHGESTADPLAAAFERITVHEEQLAERLLEFLRSRPGVRIVGPESADRHQRVPTVSFTIDGRRSSELPPRLDERRLAVRYGHFYAYRPVRDLDLLERDGVVRVSMVHYNTVQEVERLVGALEELV